MPRAPLALFLLLVAGCDETRGHIVSLRLLDPSAAGSASSGAGGASAMDAGLIATSGAPTQPPDSGAPGGAGGSALVDSGLPPVVCSPLPPKPWVATGHPSSLAGVVGEPLYNPPGQAVDDMPETRWSTGADQAGGEWIEVDFGVEVTVTRVELAHSRVPDDTAANPDYPRGYSVSMSNTTRDFGAPELARGQGSLGMTLVYFTTAHTGRFLMIQQTGVATDSRWWTIHELYAFCDPQ